MTVERWQQISRLYHAVLSQETGARAAFLAEACGPDAELRATIELLLSDKDTARGFLGAQDLEDVARALADLPPAFPAAGGGRVGPYQIRGEIGRGGMGTVFLADRVDDTFHKRVAIKVVRGLGDGDIVTRFRQEREILASLDHPAIAGVVDGGSTDDGWPYFVMDYVDGQPIDDWCDQHKADVTRRLELFREVCAGVQYAHDHLVLHRDLKPANIFVTADGAVKLLDFGIAKLLDSGPYPATSANTVTALRVMTPTYASPEQVRGEPLAVTSDVYALGVVLYELLTGHWPYRATGQLLHEISHAICEAEPTMPSVAIDVVEEAPGELATTDSLTPEHVSDLRSASPAQLRRRLEGDLDRILLKALDKIPARRYPSVERFSDDVRRHLEGRPVSAQPDTYRYRLGKFVRRHPVGVATAILVAIAQQVSFFTTVWEIRAKVPVPPVSGVMPDVRPELVSLTFLALALLVGAAYISRARAMRVAGSVLGATVFSVFVTVVPISMGWRRFVALQHPSQSLAFLFAIAVVYGAIIALAGWRIARRFGWRGMTAFVIVVSVGGPLRERMYLSAAHLEVIAPGVIPWIANTISWVFALVLSYSIMRLLAGPARDDRLARSSVSSVSPLHGEF